MVIPLKNFLSGLTESQSQTLPPLVLVRTPFTKVYLGANRLAFSPTTTEIQILVQRRTLSNCVILSL